MTFEEELFLNISKLSPKERTIFERIYRVDVSHGSLKIPQEMREWAVKTFGNLEDVERQTFVKIVNRVVGEGAVFNELRLKRPATKDVNYGGFKEEIENSISDNFANPLTKTPEDTFGRISGKYSITASNIAKFDGLHGLIIFKDPNPLNFDKEKIEDYFDTAMKWFEKAHEVNKKAVYPLFVWNCLWRASASVIHGHSQVVLTEGVAFEKVDSFRKATLIYENEYLSNYFDDNFKIHKSMGLATEVCEVKVLSKLTPIKNNEVVLFSKEFNGNLACAVDKVLRTFIDKLGVESFNLVAYLKPLNKVEENWSHMPIVVRIVDRGRLGNRNSDFGSMELYAQNVVETNPYNVIRAITTPN